MNLPQGQLLRRRVLDSVETVLADALDRELTGYARLEPQETLLLSADRAGVLTFEDGVPVAAYHTNPDTAGAEALTEIASRGPYRLGLYALAADGLDQLHGGSEVQVRPGQPAEILGGSQQLAERTRARAPTERVPDTTTEQRSLDAVESFLEDESRIDGIKTRAQSEAKSRADDWNFPVE